MKICTTVILIVVICFAEVYTRRVVKITSRNGDKNVQKKIDAYDEEDQQKYEEKDDKDEEKDEEKDESILKGQYEQKQEEMIDKPVYQQKEEKEMKEEKQDKVDIGGDGGYKQQKEVKVDIGGGGAGYHQQKEGNIGGGHIPQKGGYGQNKDTYITGGSHVVVHKQIGGGYGGGYGGGHGGYGYKKQCPGGPCKVDGELIPDSESCCKYYKCDHCKPVPMKCGPGTHYSPYLKVCDFPGKSGCVARDQKCGYYFGKW